MPLTAATDAVPACQSLARAGNKFDMPPVPIGSSNRRRARAPMRERSRSTTSRANALSPVIWFSPDPAGGRGAASTNTGVQAAQRAASASVSARVLSSCRLWSGRRPGSEFPFCALPVTVDLEDDFVDHGVCPVRLSRKGVEDALEEVGGPPVAEPPEAVLQLPNRSGASRHRLPVGAIHSTAAMNNRFHPLRPGSAGSSEQCGFVLAHWTSVSTWHPFAA